MKVLQRLKGNVILQALVSFAVASLVLNILSVVILKSAHIYDIVHVLPTLLVYGPIIKLLGGGMLEPAAYIPLAVIVDMLAGGLIGWGLRKWIKKDTYRVIGIWLTFAVYWIVITFQWLPLF